MPAPGVEAVGRRRRRTPEAAQREIIEAAEALLHERPFREMTVDDVDVELAHTALLDGFIDATAKHIAEGMEAGEILPLDPRETAKAIVWMGERYLYHCYGRDRRVAPAKVVETLHTVTVRTLYGTG
jgi:hypothetical protein